MAKNLFEQFLSFASSKLAGPIAHENIYRDEPSEQSSVAKYLAKQEMAAKAKEAAAVAPTASSVEKYLARQAAMEAQVSTVAESVQGPLTGVAKYLASQGKGPAVAVKAPAPAPAPVPKTGVGKYLAGLGTPGSYKYEAPKTAAPAPKKAEKPAAKAAAATPAIEKTVQIKAAEPVIASEMPVIEAHAVEKPKPASTTIHLDDGKQCQASTVKGTQCKHTTHLGHIQRTINKQKYQFSVCNQHHNETFKPFAPLLSAEEHS